MSKFVLAEANSPEVDVSEGLSDVSLALMAVQKTAKRLPDGKRLEKIISNMISNIDEESMYVAKGEYS